MNDNYETIISAEIPAIEAEMANSQVRLEALKKKGKWGYRRRKENEKNYLEALKFCLEFCGERFYAPSTFLALHNRIKELLTVEVDLCLRIKPDCSDRRRKEHIDGLKRLVYGRRGRTFEIEREITEELEGAINSTEVVQFEALRNIIFYRRTIALQYCIQELKDIVPTVEPEIQNSFLCAGLIRGCEKEARHRRSLDMLITKHLQIEGDPYLDIIQLVTPICHAYGSRQSYTHSTRHTDSAVEQAFQRILQTLASQKEASRRAEDLADKCRTLKTIFPDAHSQIDKLFRQEIDVMKHE